jgi:hypothetical protein
VVEGDEKGEKTKVKAFLKVVYDLCVNTKTLACLFIGGNQGYLGQKCNKIISLLDNVLQIWILEFSSN